MQRNTLNFVVDAVALLSMMALASTGLLIRYTLPPGSGGRGGGDATTLWGLNRHGWGDVHFWIAVGIAGMLLLHVFLHWQWTWKTFFRFLPTRTETRKPLSPFASRAWGFGVLLIVSALIVGFLWIAQRNVITVAGNGQADPDMQAQVIAIPAVQPVEKHAEGKESIRGSMTLREVATQSGVNENELKASLGIPASASADERLGRLKREYDFDINDVRRVLANRPPANTEDTTRKDNGS